MTGLTALLEEAAHSSTIVQVPGSAPVGGGELWEDADAVAGWLQSSHPPGSVVAVALRPDRHAITLLLGAWRAGFTVASLPQRSRTTGAESYRAQLAAALAASRAVALFVDPLEVEGLGPFAGLDVHALDALPATAGPVVAGSPPALIQFSSGSTGAPKGIRLSDGALVANTGAILAALEPEEALVSYSWLPLSHDMGLIGTFLTTWLSGAPSRLGEAVIVLDDPEAFTRAPGSWLRRCADIGANGTAGPTFALDLLARRFPRPVPDLRRLRNIIVGAEPVRADVLRRFGEAAVGTGLAPTALRPAYGLAETALAATMHPVDTPWRSQTVDAATLAVGGVVHATDGQELVSCGPALPGTDVRIGAGSAEVGLIELRGPSLMDGYVGRDELAAGAWFPTGDLGFVEDGELYVVGRADDRLTVAGRNVYPSDVEHAAGTVAEVRYPMIAAIDDGAGKFLIVAALRRSRLHADLARDVAFRIRRAVTAEIGLTPTSVAFTSPRSFPLTPSGKVQRRAVAASLADGSLQVGHHVRFGAQALGRPGS
jgi:acyl-CoA synthetase (AMP-forming)/AMP-acid ligase II